MNVHRHLTYDDIALVPSFSNVLTRQLCNTTADLGKFKFNIPVMPSNMKCVVDTYVSFNLAEAGYFYTMHRFDGITVPFVEEANKVNAKIISISTGVNDDSKEELIYIADKKLRVDYITIDIAHGHHVKMYERIRVCRELFPDTFIIAGNVTTSEAFKDLEEWGANAIKVGIGQGRACTTKLKTGFTMPMFTAIKEISSALPNRTATLIADGGIQHNGDIAKALVAGADWVMAGGIFAGCSDSPAPINADTGSKTYYGSASAKNKEVQKNIEGTTISLNCTGETFVEKMQEIREDLQSAISYAGGHSLSAFNNVKWIRV